MNSHEILLILAFFALVLVPASSCCRAACR